MKENHPDFNELQYEKRLQLFELKKYPLQFVEACNTANLTASRYLTAEYQSGEESEDECEEESEDECEEESKEKSKERSLTQNNWVKKSFGFLLLSAEFVVEFKKLYIQL